MLCISLLCVLTGFARRKHYHRQSFHDSAVIIYSWESAGVAGSRHSLWFPLRWRQYFSISHNEYATWNYKLWLWIFHPSMFAWILLLCQQSLLVSWVHIFMVISSDNGGNIYQIHSMPLINGHANNINLETGSTKITEVNLSAICSVIFVHIALHWALYHMIPEQISITSKISTRWPFRKRTPQGPPIYTVEMQCDNRRAKGAELDSAAASKRSRCSVWHEAGAYII